MDELRQLCAEIRSYMVEVCSDNPGHLASSLGAVELIVGVHYVYDTPDDKFVIDVGHQGYAHKILTGRREEFRTLREKGGISGFPNMKESKWDAFGVGHSSTSISAALGYAEAARILGNGAKSVALIGDGALTGGLAYEAMNNAGVSKSDLLILLNDNNQSIDKAVGGVHTKLMSAPSKRMEAYIYLTVSELFQNLILRNRQFPRLEVNNLPWPVIIICRKRQRNRRLAWPRKRKRRSRKTSTVEFVCGTGSELSLKI